MNFLKEVRSCYLEMIGIGYKIITTLYSIIFLVIFDADHPFLFHNYGLLLQNYLPF